MYTHTHSLHTHSLTHSLTPHSLTPHSLTHSSLTHSLTPHSLTPHSPTHSLTPHSLTHSLTHFTLTYSLTHTLTPAVCRGQEGCPTAESSVHSNMEAVHCQDQQGNHSAECPQLRYICTWRQLIFLRKSDCLECAVLLCLVVCLTLLVSFFLPSFSSLIKTGIDM